VDKVLSDPREKNLVMLLSAVDCCKLEVSPDAYRNAVEAISRFNKVTYHVRWQYLRERLLSVRDLLTGRFGAQKQVARILGSLDSGTEGADVYEAPRTSRRPAA
jgi:hypothetical protein